MAEARSRKAPSSDEARVSELVRALAEAARAASRELAEAWAALAAAVEHVEAPGHG